MGAKGFICDYFGRDCRDITTGRVIWREIFGDGFWATASRRNDVNKKAHQVGGPLFCLAYREEQGLSVALHGYRYWAVFVFYRVLKVF